MKPMIIDLKLPHWASLLECPFCGGEAELVSDGDGVYSGCSNRACVIKPITDTYSTKREQSVHGTGGHKWNQSGSALSGRAGSASATTAARRCRKKLKQGKMHEQ